jgi:hypothetical protein
MEQMAVIRYNGLELILKPNEKLCAHSAVRPPNLTCANPAAFMKFFLTKVGFPS